MRTYTWLFVCFLLFPLVLSAGVKPFFEKVSGVSGNVYCVYQDINGYIWIGSKSGVAKYDGLHFIYHNKQDSILTLTDNYVQSIVEDTKGRLWLGTRNGLNIINKDRLGVKHIFADRDGYSMSHAEVREVIQEDEAHYWIATYGGGLNFYNEYNEEFKYYYHDKEDEKSVPGNNVNDLFKDSQGKLWVGCEVGGLALFDNEKKEFNRFTIGGREEPYTVSAIEESADGTIWVGTWKKGLYKVNLLTLQLELVYKMPSDNNPKNTIRRLLFDQSGELLLGTLGGLGVYDTLSKEVEFYTYDSKNDLGIKGNAIWALYRDREQILWVGLLTKGVCKWDANAHRFPLLKTESVEYAPSEDAINSLMLDQDSLLWISTREGGVSILDWLNGRYLDNRQFRKLNGQSVTCIVEDYLGNKWFAADYGVYKWDVDLQRLVEFSRQIFSLSNEEIGGIYSCAIGKDSALYIGGWGTGMIRIRKELLSNVAITGNDLEHLTKKNSVLESNVLWQVLSDNKGNVWMNTKRGVYVYNEEKEALSRLPGSLLSLRLSKNVEGTIYGLDPEGQVYELIKRKAPRLIKDFSSQGIRIEKAFIDNQLRMWISSSRGLIVLDNEYKERLIFKESSGLASGSQFTNYALLGSGKVALGTKMGLVIVNEEVVTNTTISPRVKLRDITLFGKSLGLSQNETCKFELPYDQNGLDFFFSPMTSSKPINETIFYKLTTEKRWHSVSKNVAHGSYPHLQPGGYSLEVKTMNADGYESEVYKLTEFVINDPFWLSWWAYICYSLILLVVFRLFYSYSLISVKKKGKMELEAYKVNEKERQVEQRLNFFTQLSHEIKTPLTLILGPVDAMLDAPHNISVEMLKTVKKNADHLDKLVEELLMFRKIERGLSTLNLNVFNLIDLVNSVYGSFQALANLQQINFQFTHKITFLYINADREKIRKVLYNLLSNAFKFTPERGRIKVILDVIEAPNVGCDGEIQIRIIDTGSGVSVEMLDVLFDPYVSDDTNNLNTTGTGLGLAFVKRVIELHNGDVTAHNHSNGAEFVVILPFDKGIKEECEQDGFENQLDGIQINDTSKSNILLVEDNIEIQTFIKSLLKPLYEVYAVNNGVEALELISRLNPDLILSDVMMPVMGGIELCGRVKSNLASSHIPVVLLTAKGSEEDIIIGLERKADDYISKPFNSKQLLLKIRNLIVAQQVLKQQFQLNERAVADTSMYEGADQKLLDQLLVIIDNNIDNDQLNVVFIGNEIGIHRTTLSKKIKALTGFSPIEFIKHIRLKKGHNLLVSGKYTVAEVAYAVGYSNPRYFSTSFKEKFGITPSEIIG